MSRGFRWVSAAVVTISFAVLGAATLEAASVTRGPYLQMGTPTSVVVRWRTDVVTDSRVTYGTAPDNLISSVQDVRAAEMSSTGDYWFLDDIQIIGVR